MFEFISQTRHGRRHVIADCAAPRVSYGCLDYLVVACFALLARTLLGAHARC